jgi:hypothetical protein
MGVKFRTKATMTRYPREYVHKYPAFMRKKHPEPAILAS